MPSCSKGTPQPERPEGKPDEGPDDDPGGDASEITKGLASVISSSLREERDIDDEDRGRLERHRVSSSCRRLYEQGGKQCAEGTAAEKTRGAGVYSLPWSGQHSV